MIRTLAILVTGIGLAAMPAPAAGDTAFDAPGNFKPIVPGYFADPTLEQFGDLFYLYATGLPRGGLRFSLHALLEEETTDGLHPTDSVQRRMGQRSISPFLNSQS